MIATNEKAHKQNPKPDFIFKIKSHVINNQRTMIATVKKIRSSALLVVWIKIMHHWEPISLFINATFVKKA